MWLRSSRGVRWKPRMCNVVHFSYSIRWCNRDEWIRLLHCDAVCFTIVHHGTLPTIRCGNRLIRVITLHSQITTPLSIMNYVYRTTSSTQSPVTICESICCGAFLSFMLAFIFSGVLVGGGSLTFMIHSLLCVGMNSDTLLSSWLWFPVNVLFSGVLGCST